MKNFLYALVLLFTLAACKKHSDRPAVWMTMLLNSDTAWTTTNVSTDNQNSGNVYITGTNSATNEQISLAISGFVEGKKAYYIDYRGVGGNITGNTGTYSKGSGLLYASTGNIFVTSVTGNTINGSFDLYLPNQHINGFFTAAKN